MFMYLALSASALASDSACCDHPTWRNPMDENNQESFNRTCDENYQKQCADLPNAEEVQRMCPQTCSEFLGFDQLTIEAQEACLSWCDVEVPEKKTDCCDDLSFHYQNSHCHQQVYNCNLPEVQAHCPKTCLSGDKDWNEMSDLYCYEFCPTTTTTTTTAEPTTTTTTTTTTEPTTTTTTTEPTTTTTTEPTTTTTTTEPTTTTTTTEPTTTTTTEPTTTTTTEPTTTTTTAEPTTTTTTAGADPSEFACYDFHVEGGGAYLPSVYSDTNLLMLGGVSDLKECFERLSGYLTTHRRYVLFDDQNFCYLVQSASPIESTDFNCVKSDRDFAFCYFLPDETKPIFSYCPTIDLSGLSP